MTTTTGAWVRNGDRWQVEQRTPTGALQLRSLGGRGTVTLPGIYTQEGHVALAYAVTVHRSQGVTTDQAVLVVDRSTSAEHLYVGLTRGRHHNQACVVTEPGDEHTPHRQMPTAAEVLTAALKRTRAEKSATETLQSELTHLRPDSRDQVRVAIVEGLRQAQQHSYQQAIRRQVQRQALMSPDSGAGVQYYLPG